MGAIHQGDLRFEHCMALDARPTVADDTRRACWADWIAYYTYGQTRDRVRHAQMRIEQLSGGDAFAPQEEARSSFAADPRVVRHGALCANTCASVRDDCSRGCAAPAPRGAKGSAAADDEASRCHAQCESSFASCLGSCR